MMKHHKLIAMFVAFGLIALAGVSHAMFDTFLPSGAKAKADIVGNKLMVQGKDGRWAPAPDGVYKGTDGKSVVVQGGIIATDVPARGGIMMDKKDQDKPKLPDRPKPDKPDKKGEMMADPATPGQGPVKALPMPQGIQDPGKALPMPQGTQGSTRTLGSPKDPMEPEGSAPPSLPTR